MSLTIDTLLKSQGEVHLSEIEINWYFTPQNDEENAIEIQGTYNIDSYYDSHITEIQHPRTHVTGFYEIFNKLQFTDIATQSTFILAINHITEYDVSDVNMNVEFIFHRSIPQIAFNIELPIIAGVANISSSSENLLMFQSLIHKNLHLHFSDHVFKIPRCTRCGSALTVQNQVDMEDEVINEDFVCMDCYTVMNNFYNLLEKEVFKITEHEQMKEQRDVLVKFLITGKKNASQIEETQLQHFYNLLIIYVEYLSGNLDSVNVLQKIQAVQTIGANQNFPLLQKEAEKLLDLIDFGQAEETVPEPIAPESETWTPPVETESEPEPIPPPLPLGTPSSSTILPHDEELSEGLQSLEEVQAELMSTLEALSQIESDLAPRPISPTDQLHAVNADMDEEESDKIPTFDDIKETFSDLESLDFPDIRFGTDHSVSEDVHESNEYTPPSPSSNMPTIQELPAQETEREEITVGLNPPPGASVPEKEFSDTGTVKTMDNLPFGEPAGLQGEIKEGASESVSLNPPPGVAQEFVEENPQEIEFQIPAVQDLSVQEPPQTQPDYEETNESSLPLNPPPSQEDGLSPNWRTIEEVQTPQMNPPPQSVSPPPLNPPLENEQIQEPEEESESDSEVLHAFIIEEPHAPHVVGSIFNNNRKPPVNSQNVKKAQPEAKRKATAPKPSPKETRAKRDRRSKNRKIICSFCGQTMVQGKKICTNCGSSIK